MTTRPVPLTSETAEQIGRAWLYHAHKIDLFVAHSRDELRMIDGFPAGGDGGDGDHQSTTEAAAMVRYAITSDREQARDDLATLVELSNSFFRVLDIGLGRRAPAPEVGHCSTPSCQHWPSTHTAANGATVTDRCDSCWTELRCQVCGQRDHEGRTVDGRPACGACYRADLRTRVGKVKEVA